MADEKRVRVSITGDASGLNKEFSRIQRDAREAFKNIGLDGILEHADKSFKKIQDRIKSVGEALKDAQKDAHAEFDKRYSRATNDFAKKRVRDDRNEYDQSQKDAWDKWQRLADYFKELLKKKEIDEEGNPLQPDDPDNPKKKLTLGERVAMRSVAGGKFNPSGGIHEAVAGEGGIAEALGLGTAGAFIAGAVATALVAVIAKAGQEALKDIRVEGRVAAKFRTGVGFADTAYDGRNPTELKEFILQQAKSRTSAQDIEEISKRRLDLRYSKGLEDDELQRFDPYRQQGAQESGRLIVDILRRSENRGILGVSGDDFTLLPQKIDQVANILSFQKSNGEKVDSSTALALVMAGSKIGGRFADDRASEAFGRIDSNIKNPGNPGLKAFIFEELRKMNPKASFTDLLAKQENGASAENLRAILPDIAKMPQGEMRRMFLHQFTNNWQDAIRLDRKGSLQEMLSALNESPISDKEAQKRFGEAHILAKQNVDGFTTFGAKVQEYMTDFGHSFMDPINETLKGGIPVYIPNVGFITLPSNDTSGSAKIKANSVKKGKK